MPTSPGLGPDAVHALSNHLSVILGFVELILKDTPQDDPHYPDLVEIRDAAVHAANLVNPPSDEDKKPES